MACTFDSPCLTSQVNGVMPSFGFNPHNTALFGITASFTYGTHKCYETASPTWQPVIESSGFANTCTWMGKVNSIYCPDLPVTDFGEGTHTLTYSAPRGSPAPFKPTTFVVTRSHPHHTMPEQPHVATAYVTVTLPSSTTTKTQTITHSTTKHAVLTSGTKTVSGEPVTYTSYTFEHPHPKPEFTTTTKTSSTTKTKYTTSTTTAPCKTSGWEPEGPVEGKPKPNNGWDHPAWGKPQSEEQEPDWSQWVNGEGNNPSPIARMPAIMNSEMVEEIDANGAVVRYPSPCKSACGGWSGPDYTYTEKHHEPKPTGWPDHETITWTKTTTVYYGVKTIPTTTTTWVVDFRVKKVPETTTTWHSKTSTTKTLPPKFTPHWTKTLTKETTTTLSITKKATTTVPCKVKVITSLKTETFIETVHDNQPTDAPKWPREGEEHKPWEQQGGNKPQGGQNPWEDQGGWQESGKNPWGQEAGHYPPGNNAPPPWEHEGSAKKPAWKPVGVDLDGEFPARNTAAPTPSTLARDRYGQVIGYEGIPFMTNTNAAEASLCSKVKNVCFNELRVPGTDGYTTTFTSTQLPGPPHTITETQFPEHPRVTLTRRAVAESSSDRELRARVTAAACQSEMPKNKNGDISGWENIHHHTVDNAVQASARMSTKEKSKREVDALDRKMAMVMTHEPTLLPSALVSATKKMAVESGIALVSAFTQLEKEMERAGLSFMPVSTVTGYPENGITRGAKFRF